jgi:hypothetical protein
MLKTLQNFYKATTSRAWAIGTGNRYLSTLPTPSAGYLVISPSDTTKREIIAYSGTGTDSLGSYVTVTTRGVGGTTEQAHSKNEPVRMNIIAQHYSEVQDEVTDLQGQIDTLVLQNAPNASTTVRGIVLMSTAPAEAGTAIVVGTNDPRIPTTEEKTLLTDLEQNGVPSVGFGSGADGDVTISSGTTTLTKDMYYNNLTVNGTGILKTGGFRIFVKETLTVDGTSGASINNAGGNGGNGTNGTGGGAQGMGGDAGAASAAGFFAGGVAGAAGGNSSRHDADGSAGSTGTASGALALNNNAGVAGGKGADGVGGTPRTGGAGGAGGAVTSAATQLPYSILNLVGVEITGTGTLTLTKQNISPSGGGGGGGAGTSAVSNAYGGGGGGSGGTGGFVFIVAKYVNLTGVGCINANGGNGGNGGTSAYAAVGGGGGGAGGNGGVCLLAYYSKTGTGTATANGGTGGTVGANGTGGANGTNGVNGLVIQINS